MSEGGNNEGMFGNLFEEDKEDYDIEDKSVKITKQLEGAALVDFAPLLTLETCYFLVLAHGEGGLRLLVHTILDKNTDSCNSAFHYTITKTNFVHGVSICSEPLTLEDGPWEIANTEFNEKD